MSDNEKKERAEELKDEELEEVSGGINVKRGPSQHVLSGQIETKMPSAGVAHSPVVQPTTMPKVVKK